MRVSKPVLFAFGVVACAFVAFVAVKAVRMFVAPPPVSGISIATGAGRLGGPFTLVDQTGRRVTDRDFRGRYMLIYFGYTHCPDECPTELQAIGRAIDELGPLGDRVTPVFISVDPGRDTPAVIGKYVRAFHPRMVGLTGTPAEIAAVARAYQVPYKVGKPSEPEAGDYSVSHNLFLYLVDPRGKFVAVFRGGAGPDAIAKALRATMG